MCGIIGAFTDIKDIKERISMGLDCLKHRGPDDKGVEEFLIEDRSLVLGHARLSIIDLTAGGHQPMSTADKRYTIVFNGEIYNYKELKLQLEALGCTFTTGSDTEVLLACWAKWGESCLRMLKGMFAFALVDHKEQSLVCVRDGFGIKPFYYISRNGNLYFASEVKALTTLDPGNSKPDWQTVYNYLVYGRYDDDQQTFFEGVKSLLPGHLFKISLKEEGEVKQKRWWNPSIKQTSTLSFEEATKELRRLFLENVALHLRSDVPVGAALSGGLDSSAVVCAMRHLEPTMPIHTFTYVAKDSPVDEEKWADIVNDYVNAVPHKVYVESKDLDKDFIDMVESQGEPFGGTSIYAQYRVFHAAKEEGIIVTLDGQGADELLAGYTGYPEARSSSLMQQGKILTGIKFLQEWVKWPGRSKTIALKAFFIPFIPNKIRRIINKRNLNKEIPDWINKDIVNKMRIDLNSQAIDPTHLEDKPRGRELMNALRATMTGNGLNLLLRHADRNAMRWSIESRVPFLTIELAEFLLSLPEEYLISSKGETKYLFREAMRGIVPDAILDRHDKIGFATPEFELLKGQTESIKMWVNHAKLPIVDKSMFTEHIQKTLQGEKPYSSVTWRMINMCGWVSQIEN